MGASMDDLACCPGIGERKSTFSGGLAARDGGLVADDQRRRFGGWPTGGGGPAGDGRRWRSGGRPTGEKDPQNCSSVKKVLEKYATLAGQVLNKDKSIVIFSPNTPRQFKRMMASILGAKTSNKLGRYLGVKVDNRFNSANLFNEMVEKVESKLAGEYLRGLSTLVRCRTPE
ncbi:uncharacterized protein G2W53_041545 [Senna tora]|uniref:Uncharacterized protein n=1 Tax=Senna tora TaxID=362788 RepID=A0A834SFC2_9FABA|nr:uncharacterized protein G2W53_041545 [Senna tora]